jgi:hypothetical protein
MLDLKSQKEIKHDILKVKKLLKTLFQSRPDSIKLDLVGKSKN